MQNPRNEYPFTLIVGLQGMGKTLLAKAKAITNYVNEGKPIISNTFIDKDAVHEIYKERLIEKYGSIKNFPSIQNGITAGAISKLAEKDKLEGTTVIIDEMGRIFHSWGRNAESMKQIQSIVSARTKNVEIYGTAPAITEVDKIVRTWAAVNTIQCFGITSFALDPKVKREVRNWNDKEAIKIDYILAFSKNAMGENINDQLFQGLPSDKTVNEVLTKERAESESNKLRRQIDKTYGMFHINNLYVPCSENQVAKARCEGCGETIFIKPTREQQQDFIIKKFHESEIEKAWSFCPVCEKLLMPKDIFVNNSKYYHRECNTVIIKQKAPYDVIINNTEWAKDVCKECGINVPSLPIDVKKFSTPVILDYKDDIMKYNYRALNYSNFNLLIGSVEKVLFVTDWVQMSIHAPTVFDADYEEDNTNDAFKE